MEEPVAKEAILSVAQVAKIVAKKHTEHNFSIVDYTLTESTQVMGLCGDHAILTVHLKSETLTFFVKLFPRFQSVVEFAVCGFRKEHFVYDLFAKFRAEGVPILKSVPDCYYRELNKLLVLENLAEQDYRCLDKRDYLSYETVQVVLEALAKLHCASFIYEEKRSEALGSKYRMIDEYETDFEETYYNEAEDFPMKQSIRAAINGILNCTEIYGFETRLLSGKNLKETLKKVCFGVYKLAKPSNKFRNVLCHGDLWSTNFMVQVEGKRAVRCKFVDFQCGRYVPPAQDVLSMIYLTTSKEFRKKHMYKLIGFYYSNLEKIMTVAGYKLEGILPFTQFLESCEQQKVFAMVQAAIYFPLILLESETVLDYFKNNELNRTALLEDRSLLVLNHKDKDECYDRRIRESLEDLKDYCDFL